MLEFEPQGEDYFVAEKYHEHFKCSIIYIIEKYSRPGLTAWEGRALSRHDIVAQCEMMPTFEDVEKWANHVSEEIDAGRLWQL